MNKNLIAITIIAAITVLIIYSINFHTIQLPSEQLKNDYWEQEAKYTTENASLICPPSKSDQPISPNSCKRQDHYSYDRQHQIADHKAQVSMRNAAWAGMIIGISGLILLWLTLRATKSAAESTSEALKEARRVSDLTFAQTRAWLTPTQPFWLRYKSGPIFAEIRINFMNTGNTPALNPRLLRSTRNFL